MWPNVRAAGFGGQGHVDPVVDDQGHAGRLADGVELARQLEQLQRRGGFGAQLDRGDAAPNRGRHDVGASLPGRHEASTSASRYRRTAARTRSTSQSIIQGATNRENTGALSG